jgi:hypothetical protein
MSNANNEPDYGRDHRRKRAREARRVATGTVRCARGAQCKYAVDGIAGLIAADAEWDLGHVDGDPTRYAGPEHAECNRATSSHRPPRKRPTEAHPGLTPGG